MSGAYPNEALLRQALEGGDPAAFQTSYLVEAGAGAGKTHTLVQRIASQLAEGHCEPEQIVVITFTVKATEEMRGRLDRELRQRHGDAQRQFGPGDSRTRRLAELADSVGRMQISTVHSFCQTLLQTLPFSQRYGMEMQVLEERDAEQAAGAFFDRRYRENPNRFSAARDRFGVTQGELRSAFLRVCGARDARLAQFDDVALAKLETQLKTDLCKRQKKAAAIPLSDRLRDALPKALRQAAGMDPAAFAADTTAQTEFCRILCARSSFRFENWDLRQAWTQFQELFKLSALGGETGAELSYLFQNYPVLYDYAAIQQVEKLWTGKDVAAIRETVRQLTHSACIRALVQLRDEYRAELLKTRQVTFDDLLHTARDMLRDDAGARAYFHDRYRVLYVDEFQDTDLVQAQLFFYLTNERGAAEGFDPADWRTCRPRPGSLFLVGDPKQAIYRFRGADIDVYHLVRERFRDAEAGQGPQEPIGEHVRLHWNFRSDRLICERTKEVFSALLDGKKHQAPFQEMEAVRPASGLARAVWYELGELPDADAAFAADAERVAAFIAEMCAARLPLTVRANGTEVTRPARYGDFLILTLNKRETADYVEALARRGIPTDVAGKAPYRSVEPIRRCVMVLRLLLEPTNPAAVLQVLRECFQAEWTDLRRFLERGDYRKPHAPLSDPERLRRYWRALAAEPEPDGALLELCAAYDALIRLAARSRTEPGLSLIAGLLDGGPGLWPEDMTPAETADACGRIRQFLNALRALPEHSFPALARRAVLLAEEGAEERQLLLEETADCVRVMNVHKAKGLEGTVVILTYSQDRKLTADRHLDRDAALEYLTLRHWTGWAMADYAVPPDWKSAGGKKAWGKQTIEEDYLKAERVRLLYVAATRAESMLVVCARGGKDNKETAWGPVAFGCDAASVEDPDYGAAFRALLEDGTAPASGSVAPMPLDKTPDQLERALEQRAAAFDSAVLAITPSRLEHGTERAPLRRLLEAEEDALTEPQAEGDTSSEPETGIDTPPEAEAAENAPEPRGADWGTVVHRVLELCVRRGRYDAGWMRACARQAAAETLGDEPLTERQKLLLGCPGQSDAACRASVAEQAWQRTAFLRDSGSPLRRLLDAPGARAYPELPFYLRAADCDTALYRHLAAHCKQDPAGKPLDVQGIIDLAISRDGAWTLIDYKTDIPRAGERDEDLAERLRAHYTAQLTAYAQVLELLGIGHAARVALCSVPLGGALLDLPVGETRNP